MDERVAMVGDNGQQRIVAYYERRLEALKAELADARAALRWYAGDGSTYDGIDVGQKARAVLERYGKGK